LPTTLQPDASCSDQIDPGGGFDIQGSGAGCTGSEMGNLYNVEGVTAASPGLFSDVQVSDYWSSTEYAPNTGNAWDFSMALGTQSVGNKNNLNYAWAVQSGNVGAVPVPAADAGGPYTVGQDTLLSFNGSASTPSEGGTIISWDWDFGDGNTGTGVEPTHTYIDDGVFEVTLVVTDDTDATDDDVTQATVSINNLPPVAEAGGPYPGVKDVAVTFDGTGSGDPDGGSLVYSWDFGDGSLLGSGVSPTHTYTTAGVRNVILTVTDDAETSASDSASALIASGTTPPVADIGGPYEGFAGVPVHFDGTSSSDPDGGRLLYAWDFGDDTNASGAMPIHTYVVSGTFDVTLRVIDDSAKTDTDGTSIVIQGSATNLIFADGFESGDTSN
jgi:PKD repeat protein